MQHSRPPCPSLSPRVCSKPCPLSQWCYCIISSSAALFSFCLMSFIASGSFQMSQLFASDDQSILELQLSISPSNEYSELISFRIDWFDLLAVQGTHKSLLQHHSTNSSGLSFLYGSAVISVHDFWKSNSFDYGPLLARWCLCILICSLGLSQLSFQGKLGISWQQSLFAVILETKERKSVTVSTFSPSICHEVIGPDAMILVFWMLVLSQLFHCLLSPSSRGSLVLLQCSAVLVPQSCLTLSDPMDCSLPGSLPMVFSKQEYGMGCHFPSSGYLPDPGVEPRSPTL